MHALRSIDSVHQNNMTVYTISTRKYCAKASCITQRVMSHILTAHSVYTTMNTGKKKKKKKKKKGGGDKTVLHADVSSATIRSFRNPCSKGCIVDSQLGKTSKRRSKRTSAKEHKTKNASFITYIHAIISQTTDILHAGGPLSNATRRYYCYPDSNEQRLMHPKDDTTTSTSHIVVCTPPILHQLDLPNPPDPLFPQLRKPLR